MAYPSQDTLSQNEVSARPGLLTGLTAVAVIMLIIGVLAALFYAPTEQAQGDIQRIFYIHLPAFMGAALAFFMAAVSSAIYLRTRNATWDAVAVAGVEVGLALGAFNVVSGMVWAKPIWNTWWDWSPRLTTSAIMVLIYTAYLILRNAVDDPDRRARFASVYGILAFASVIMVFVIPRIVPDIHPVLEEASNASQGAFGLEPGAMTHTLLFNFAVFVVLAITLIWHRFRLEKLSRHVLALKMQALSR